MVSLLFAYIKSGNIPGQTERGIGDRDDETTHDVDKHLETF